jgi:hypothetical protein
MSARVHLYAAELGPYGPIRVYCGRVDRGQLIVEFEDARRATCAPCRRAMTRDWCERCGRLLVAWEPDLDCACDAREGE